MGNSQWNLSVNLRGDGAQLARALREGATFARSLAGAARLAQAEVRGLSGAGARVRTLGADAQFASRHIRTLGQDARTAARLAQQSGERSRAAGRQVRAMGNDAEFAGRHLRTLGEASRAAASAQNAATRDAERLGRQLRALTADMTRLGAAARTAATRTRTMGEDGTRSMGRMATAAASLRGHLSNLVGILAGGGLFMGMKELVKTGNEYQRQTNTLGAVTNANAIQMIRAGAIAHQLGSDLTLPASTAADAAEAMVDLAKAGFKANMAMAAARPALELSTGLHVAAADAAMYLGDTMDQFGLGANQAAKAADTLAATATGASGGIKDIWYAMKYAGPVANALGVSMQDTAAAIVGLGKAGIIGQTAGTTLRGAFSNLAAPTDQMADGLKTLGIQAFDSQGKFKGLTNVIGGLHKAQHELTNEEFVGAVKKAFGKPAMSGMIALGHQGVDAFQTYQVAVNQTGKAAQIAGAQSKGLTGAMTQLKTQSKTTGLAIYEGMSPGLEYITRGITGQMADATPLITEFFKHLNSLATLFGPSVKSGIGDLFSGIGAEGSKMTGPLKELAKSGAADALHVLLSTGQTLVDVVRDIVHGVEPVVTALGDLSDGGNGAANSMDILILVLDHALQLLAMASGILVPIGQTVGTLVHAFGALPGPIQSAVFSMLLFRRFGPMLAGLGSTMTGSVMGPFRSFGQQMAVQRSLAASAGVSLSRYGAAFAVLQTRIPVLGSMTSSFRTASAAGGTFTGTLRGMGAAAGAGLRGALGGVVGALGGPWGTAIVAGTVLLGMYASSQQKAAQAAAQHKADVDGLAQALKASNGIINESVRQQAAQSLQNTKVDGLRKGTQSLVDIMGQAGYSLRETTDAYLGQGASVDTLAKKLNSLADEQDALEAAASKGKKFGDDSASKKYSDQAAAYRKAAESLQGMSGDAKTAAKNAKDLADATSGTKKGVTAYDSLKNAVGALANKTSDADTRTRALKDALDLLAGGTVTMQAAMARVNEALTNGMEQAKSVSDAHTQALKEGIKYTDGWGKQLITTTGTVDSVTKNGQQLYNSLTSITEATGNAAIAAYDLAQKQDKSLPESLKAAQDAMARSRDQAVKLGQQYGLTAADAGKVADSMGLIPGQVAILLETQGVDTTLAELLAVQAQIRQTPGAKVIKVDTLSDEAKAKLETLGFKVRTLPGSREIEITMPAGKVLTAADTIQTAINSLQGKTIHVTTFFSTVGKPGDADGNGIPDMVQARKDGAVVDYYANGGMRGPRENHVAQIAPAGSYRVWGEKETGGESYIPLHPAKRTRSKAIAEETVRRLGGKGIEWHADGSVTDWRYDPVTGSLYSTSDATQAAHKTRKVTTKTRGKNGKITTDTKDVDYFDEAALEQKLATSSAAAHRWNVDLANIANRVGGDVANALAAMGADGVELTHKMATGTTKYVNQMAASLRGLAQTARASLTDYARQLNNTTAANSAFQANLSRLAGMGYGDLASQLASQNDLAAQQMAVDALRNGGMAKNANAAAKRANTALSSDEVVELIRIIAAVTSNRVGIHSVADTTGLGEDEIVTVAGKATAQIKAALGARGSKFLADLVRGQKGLSFADGGIRPGLYSTRNGAVTFAEPSTGGEAFIPLGANKRAAATNVLHDVANRFGVGVTPAGSVGGRPIVIIRETGGTTVHVSTVRTNATASDIGTQVNRSVRRARRGGVASRAGS